MDKALLTFSNGKTLELHEGQKIIPIVKIDTKDGISTSQSKLYEVWYHHSAGFVPSITELLCSCDFFCLLEDENKVYSSSAVVSIENK